MSLHLRVTGLLFAFIFAANIYAYSQSVRGKVIYVSSLQDVKLKFRSAVSNYSFVNKTQATAFKIKLSGSRNLHVNSAVENFKPANLVITEGSNTHLFILAYKSSLDESTETLYDFSSKEKLQRESQKVMARKTAEPVQNIQVKNTATTQTNTIVTQAVITHAVDQTANKTEPIQTVAEVPAGPQTTAAAEPDNKKQITTVSNAPAKTNQEIATTPTYSSEIARATAAFKAKDYVSAKAYYQSAQKLNPSAKYPGIRISELNVLIAKQRKKGKLRAGQN
jgi:hypothetical protein